MTKKAISKKAEEYLKLFDTKRNEKGEEVITLKYQLTNKKYQQLAYVIYSLDNRLDFNWIVDKINYALDDIADYWMDKTTDKSDWINEAADYQVDIYTNDLLDWVNGGFNYINEVIKWGDCDRDKGLTYIIQRAQFNALTEIYYKLFDMLEGKTD